MVTSSNTPSLAKTPDLQIRLNSLLEAANYTAMSGDLHGWRKILLRIYIEIRGYIKDNKDIEKATKTIHQIDKIYATYLKIFNGEERFSEAPIMKYQSELHNILFNFEIELRDLMIKYGVQIEIPGDTRGFE